MKTITQDSALTSMAFLDDGVSLALGSAAGRISLHDLRKEVRASTRTLPPSLSPSLILSIFSLPETLQGEPLRVFAAHAAPVASLRFTHGSASPPSAAGPPATATATNSGVDKAASHTHKTATPALLQAAVPATPKATPATSTLPGSGLPVQLLCEIIIFPVFFMISSVTPSFSFHDSSLLTLNRRHWHAPWPCTRQQRGSRRRQWVARTAWTCSRPCRLQPRPPSPLRPPRPHRLD